jgi:hypothetical protein
MPSIKFRKFLPGPRGRASQGRRVSSVKSNNRSIGVRNCQTWFVLDEHGDIVLPITSG